MTKDRDRVEQAIIRMLKVNEMTATTSSPLWITPGAAIAIHG